MSDTNDGGAISDSDTDATARYIILQALADLVLDTELVIGEKNSRTLLRQGYRAATDRHQREALERLFRATELGSESTGGTTEVVQVVVDAVHSELVERGIAATLVHEVTASLESREVGLYNFAISKSPNALENIPLSAEVRKRVMDGAEQVAAEEYRQAISSFEDALAYATTTNDEITPRVLAAWTHHWNGADGYALDFVDEALHLHYAAWSPRLIGAVADHSSPELFREGHLSVRAYLRVVASIPEKSIITAAVGFLEGDTASNWEPLSGELDCLKLPYLTTDMRIRLRLTGTLGSMPSLQAYYLAIGTVDEENKLPRSVLHQILTGPSGLEPLESISFRRQ